MNESQEPVPCSGPDCQNAVRIRRPSHSGQHFCRAPKCQAAKQRFYRARATDRAAKTEVDLIAQLISSLAHTERQECPSCGLADALPGWAHRRAPGSNDPCLVLGSRGAGLPKGMLDLVHPERAPA